jgi:GNAT superfamily N-acetyltransferase
MLEFRELSVDDIDIVTELFVKIFSQPPWLDEWDSLDHAKRYLRDYFDFPGFMGFSVLRNGQIVGLALGNLRHWWQGEEYFLYEFGIDPDIQGTGVGGSLLEYIEKVLRANHVCAMTLLTERATLAEKFYLKHDFKVSKNTVFMVKMFES